LETSFLAKNFAAIWLFASESGLLSFISKASRLVALFGCKSKPQLQGIVAGLLILLIPPVFPSTHGIFVKALWESSESIVVSYCKTHF